MKEVSLHELKRNLSALIAEAERGEAIVITRHRRPVARIETARGTQVHRGDRFGRADLRALFERSDGKLGRRALDILREDRHGGPDR